MTNLRRAGTTSAAVLTGLVATLGLTHVAAPEWVRCAGLALWNFPDARGDLLELNAESARLNREAEQLRVSIEAADHITSRLIARDLTLAGATDLLEPLMEARPGFKELVATSCPATTFRMAVARSLIDRVRRTHHADPSRLSSLEAQLEVEYGAMR